VGVDVETDRRDADRIPVAERFFAPIEVEAVKRSRDVARAFYETWTAKESVIKAVGGGLSIDLASFQVAPHPDRFTPVESNGDAERLKGWFIRTLPEPGPGAHAAVAVRGDGWNVIVRSLESEGRFE
jgi:4'-phosphopantetheinyl transferase